MKTTLLFSFLSVFIINGIAQTTNIPDPIFEQELINQGYDTGPIDGSVPTSNINTITTLNIQNKNIGSLAGIEDFTALEVLYAGWNLLTSLNVTNNLNLRLLTLEENNIDELNLSHNTTLTMLVARNNALNCVNMKNGNNTNVTFFDVRTNPQLTCIEVDNVAYSNANWGSKDAAASYSAACNNNCNITVGLEENTYSSFSLYPNPSDNFLNIAFEHSYRNATVIISDLQGRTSLTKTFGKKQPSKLNVENLTPGIYFVELILDNRSVSRSQFTKR